MSLDIKIHDVEGPVVVGSGLVSARVGGLFPRYQHQAACCLRLPGADKTGGPDEETGVVMKLVRERRGDADCRD
jgi:hypothetical protein